ncbi:hypothetical protein ACFXHA_03320 [Nocardia sp. NPDC059240]|uniref:hypothetical protein n=1 Tax=Nocardia sp. NPDC059240 TaxID=3346786 RepID=UPI0036ACC4AA
MSLINFNAYDNNPPPPPRRARRGWLVGGAVVAGVLVVVLAITLRPATGQSSGPAANSDPAADLSFDPVRQQGVCLDGLQPTPDGWAQGFAAQIKTAVANLEAWDTDPENPPNTGTEQPHAGLNLWMKAVYTNSLSTDNPQFTAHAAIRSVSALKTPLPTNADPGDALYQRWNSAFEQTKADRKAAITEASKGADALGALQFPPHDSTFSGISGCISALLDDVPDVTDEHTHSASPRSFLIATDCNEPVAPQLKGSFNGATLYVIQSCVSGIADECSRYFQQFSDRMHQLHVGQIIQIPEDQAPDAIAKWIQNGSLQS